MTQKSFEDTVKTLLRTPPQPKTQGSKPNPDKNKKQTGNKKLVK